MLKNEEFVDSITAYTNQMVAQLFDDYSKMWLCLANIEAFDDQWRQSIVRDLENVGKATANNAGWIFESS